MIDNYNNAPKLYWFRTERQIFNYIALWYRGFRYVGFVLDPEDDVVEKYDLRYFGFGDIDWISEETKKRVV